MTKKSADTAAGTKPSAKASSQESGSAKMTILKADSGPKVPNANTEKTKKAAFLDRTLLRTEVKKRDAKPAIEAALAELSAALLAGEELVLPPLGKLKVVNSKDIGQGAKALTLKLRTMKTETGDEA